MGRLAAELLHDGIGRPEHLGLPERIQRGVDVLAHERRCGEHDLAEHLVPVVPQPHEPVPLVQAVQREVELLARRHVVDHDRRDADPRRVAQDLDDVGHEDARPGRGEGAQQEDEALRQVALHLRDERQTLAVEEPVHRHVRTRTGAGEEPFDAGRVFN